MFCGVQGWEWVAELGLLSLPLLEQAAHVPIAGVVWSSLPTLLAGVGALGESLQWLWCPGWCGIPLLGLAQHSAFWSSWSLVWAPLVSPRAWQHVWYRHRVLVTHKLIWDARFWSCGSSCGTRHNAVRFRSSWERTQEQTGSASISRLCQAACQYLLDILVRQG